MSRSSYKLVQLLQKYTLVQPGRIVVDLGAAPGGWSQAVLQQCRTAHVYALDLLPMQILHPRITALQGDFTDASVREHLAHLITQTSSSHDGKVDVVLSDMMANTSGNPVRDSQASLDLCTAAFEFCTSMLRPTPGPAKTEADRQLLSAFVCKYFMSQEADEFRHEVLERHFSFVRSEKMKASRSESREQYWVCFGYRGDTN